MKHPSADEGMPKIPGRAVFRAEDGTETDISHAVCILWDGVVSSLDWGSGFWNAEDAGAVAWIGHLFGFPEGRRPGDGWGVGGYVEAITAYERNRALIDSNLPTLP